VSNTKMRDFVTLETLNAAEITALLDLATRQKNDPSEYRHTQPLMGKLVGLFFEKASLRTRLSFETAVYQLGGHCIFFGPECGRIGERESIKDLAKVTARYVDAIVLRTYKQETITEMARWSSKPVINGLSDTHHPCQGLGDVLTARNGKTIEVLNTDAEGRLILADALCFAAEQTDTLVDFATLTGACLVALGTETAGLMTNNDAWGDRVLAAVKAAGERAENGNRRSGAVAAEAMQSAVGLAAWPLIAGELIGVVPSTACTLLPP